MRTHRHFLPILTFAFILVLISGCHSSRFLSGDAFYRYDTSAPLQETFHPIDGNGYPSFEVEFNSTNHERVTGILSYPEKEDLPVPVIILVHGLGDNKEVDYIEGGDKFLLDAGYAVLRIDLYSHGDRTKREFDFSFDGDARYRSREVITQSVFDLRRAIDLIETRKDLDHNRIGYFGISLGGIIGTVCSGVEDRIKVPVIVLAGGRLNLMFGINALSEENKNFLSMIDPIHFVKKISPRPLLMINAENDEVVPPMMSRFLYKKAKDPKKIIWYTATHRTIPVEQVYAEGITWYNLYL